MRNLPMELARRSDYDRDCRERKPSLMLQRKCIRVRSDPSRRGGWLAGNPLWPLEELHDLRNPRFVADPEFTPFDIDALGCDPKVPRRRQAILRKFARQKAGACLPFEGNFQFRS